MGFFSNILRLVFIALAIALVICYIIVLAIPWYQETMVYSALGAFSTNTTCTSSLAFYWFQTSLTCTPALCQSQGCNGGELFPGVRSSYWCQNFTCGSQSAVFIVSFVLILLSFLLVVGTAVVYALPMVKSKLWAYILAYVAFAMTLAALLISFALPAAAKTDGVNNSSFVCPPNGGPCSSWAGSKTWQSGAGPVQESWGPAGGWIFGLIVAVATLVWAIIACCCCAAVATDEAEEDKA